MLRHFIPAPSNERRMFPGTGTKQKGPAKPGLFVKTVIDEN
jgi:hypothetical protein